VLVVGIDPEREARVSTIKSIVREGAYLAQDDYAQALIGELLTHNLKVGIGDELTILGQGRDGSVAATVLTVKGIYKSGQDGFDRSTIQIPLAAFQDTYSPSAGSVGSRRTVHPGPNLSGRPGLGGTPSAVQHIRRSHCQFGRPVGRSATPGGLEHHPKPSTHNWRQPVCRTDRIRIRRILSARNIVRSQKPGSILFMGDMLFLEPLDRPLTLKHVPPLNRQPLPRHSTTRPSDLLPLYRENTTFSCFHLTPGQSSAKITRKNYPDGRRADRAP
jgi:hypothetical protein